MPNLILPMLLLGSALLAPAQSHYAASVAALAASQAADIASSVGRHEINPVLGRGTFGARQIGIKLTFVGSALLVQRILLRGRDHAEIERRKRVFARINFVMAGATAGVAIRNWGMR